MIQVTKNEFQEMFQLGILNGNRRDNKEWSIASRHKKSKYKTRYVSRDHYAKYVSMKNSENKETKKTKD